MRSAMNARKEQALRDEALLEHFGGLALAVAKWLLGATVAGVFLGAGTVRAQSPGPVIAGPYTATLPSTHGFSFSRSFSAPPNSTAPYLLRVELSTPNSLTELTVNLNGTRVM